MSSDIVGLIGLAVLLVLLFVRMWIAFALALVGFLGFAYIGGMKAALGVLATIPYSTVASYNMTVMPLFLLMGTIASVGGISGDLYYTAYRWMGHLRGGLAMATIAACAGFAAICGSSMATSGTMGKVAMPEMQKYHYDPKLASGCVASGATLGILIPPSLGFILYAILTEESVGLLFMAGILPGILLAILFIITIVIITKYDPQMGPRGPKTGFREKIVSLRYTWAMLCLFLLVMGGIYLGVFTPNEAGAIGAFGAIVITGINRRLSFPTFLRALVDTGQITAMILLLVVGAMIFMNFMAISKLPFALAEILKGVSLPKHVIFAAIIFVYLILGCFLDINAALILTLPIIYPSVIALGFDPIWFGVTMVITMEMGLITPPFGMNVFILGGVSGVPLATIFSGVIPFVFSMIVCLILITIFPQIALLIPSMMK
jgi:tripartite ATP-independent transporter DctM subunit